MQFTTESHAYYSGRWSKNGEYFYVNILDETSVPRFVKAFTFQNGKFNSSMLIYEEPDPAMFVALDQTNDQELVLISCTGISTSETLIINGFQVESVLGRTKNTIYKIDHHPEYGFFSLTNANNQWNNAIFNTKTLNSPQWGNLVVHSEHRYLTRLEVFSQHLVSSLQSAFLCMMAI
jgi:protease II